MDGKDGGGDDLNTDLTTQPWHARVIVPFAGSRERGGEHESHASERDSAQQNPLTLPSLSMDHPFDSAIDHLKHAFNDNDAATLTTILVAHPSQLVQLRTHLQSVSAQCVI